ncbi:MAG: hypothetical protein ACYTGF_08780 [Planctomycetota bacterium]
MASTPTTATDEVQWFDDALDHAFQKIRGAFTELLGSVNADPTRPQDLARRFGLNKNLAWKVSKIISATEPHAAVPNIPGAGGVKTLLKALAAGGASPKAVEAVRSAVRHFDEMVASHVGDRSTLRLVLSSQAPHKVQQEHLENTRKMAFQGNSSIWGIQAHVRLASFFIAPNPDDESSIDTASMGGLLDVRRLRPDASVPFFMRFAFNDDGTLRSGPSPESIDPAGGAADPLMLIQEFCSTPIPEFRAITSGSYMRYQLPPGPIGNPGRNTWIYGEYTRRFASIYRDAVNTVGEHAVPIQMPIEWLLCDLQVHRKLAFALRPRVVAYSQFATGPAPIEDVGCDQLPLAESIQSIGSAPPIVATPLVPRYPEMVQRVYDRLGWQPEEFHGFRFVMKYPPMPSSIVVQHDLAEQSASRD